MGIETESISGASMVKNGTSLRKFCDNAEEQVYHMSRLPHFMPRPKIHLLGVGFYDMEFIHGSTLLETSVHTRGKALKVLDKILDIVSYCRTNETRVLTSAYTDKIHSVMRRTEDVDLANRIQTRWIEMTWGKPVMTLPLGPVHGDMTPENIIVAPREVYFIDGIPSPVPTTLQDISKLRQEYVYGWSKARHGIDYNRRPFEALILERTPASREQLIVDFVTVARIAPYAKTNEVKTWILETLELLSSYLPLAKVSGLEEGQRHY